MERETTIIVTPIDGIEVIVKKWLTGREKREIQSVFYDTKITANDMSISGDKLTLAQDKTVEVTVISVNGKSDKILDDILDMKADDYDYVMEELNRITAPNDEFKKK